MPVQETQPPESLEEVRPHNLLWVPCFCVPVCPTSRNFLLSPPQIMPNLGSEPQGSLSGGRLQTSFQTADWAFTLWQPSTLLSTSCEVTVLWSCSGSRDEI